jgi:hypothetical protein
MPSRRSTKADQQLFLRPGASGGGGTRTLLTAHHQTRHNFNQSINVTSWTQLILSSIETDTTRL